MFTGCWVNMRADIIMLADADMCADTIMRAGRSTRGSPAAAGVHVEGGAGAAVQFSPLGAITKLFYGTGCSRTGVCC